MHERQGLFRRLRVADGRIRAGIERQAHRLQVVDHFHCPCLALLPASCGSALRVGSNLLFELARKLLKSPITRWRGIASTGTTPVREPNGSSRTVEPDESGMTKTPKR